MFLSHIKVPTVLSNPPLQERLSKLLLLSVLLLQHFVIFHVRLHNAFCAPCAQSVQSSCLCTSFHLVPTCAPMTLGWSAVFINTMTVAHVVAFEWSSMLLAVMQCLSVQPTFLGFSRMQESINSIMHFSSVSIVLVGFWALQSPSAVSQCSQVPVGGPLC